MTIKEAARIIGCSRQTIYAFEKRGLLTITRDPLLRGLPAKIERQQVEALAARRQQS